MNVLTWEVQYFSILLRSVAYYFCLTFFVAFVSCFHLLGWIYIFFVEKSWIFLYQQRRKWKDWTTSVVSFQIETIELGIFINFLFILKLISMFNFIQSSDGCFCIRSVLLINKSVLTNIFYEYTKYGDIIFKKKIDMTVRSVRGSLRAETLKSVAWMSALAARGYSVSLSFHPNNLLPMTIQHEPTLRYSFRMGNI